MTMNYLPASAKLKTRRSVLRTVCAAGVTGLFLTMGVAAGQANDETAQKIANHFSSVKTMTGEFVQFGPTGQQIGGKFFIERPGNCVSIMKSHHRYASSQMESQW